MILWETIRGKAKENQRVPGTVHKLRKRKAAVGNKESGSLHDVSEGEGIERVQEKMLSA